MEISFEGIGQVAATFAVDGDIQPGMAAVLTADSTVGIGEDGDAVCGMVLSAKNGMAAVQVGGMVKLGYSGAAPAIGWGTVAGDGTGKIKTAAEGMDCLIVAVDTADSTAVIKL